jgi:hypothetical protein
LGQLGEAEVQNFHLAFRGQHHVRRLEIAVHDSGGVSLAERVGDLHGGALDFAQTHSGARDQLVERFAGNQFHD